MKYILGLITTKDKTEAEKISQKLLEEKLIACANIVENVKSMFWWQGKVDSSNEVLIILKTQAIFFERIVEVVEKTHSYDVPEVIFLPITLGNSKYLNWIDESLS